MAPKAKELHESTRSTRSSLRRNTRAKSLPGGLESALLASSPQKVTGFDLGRILPTNVAICKACKAPIIATPPPPATPKFKGPGRSDLEVVLQSCLLEAHSRAATIRAAYSSACKDLENLGNKQLNKIPPEPLAYHPEWRTAKYTTEACKIVGTLFGELGRATATSQKVIDTLQELLAEENERLKIPMSAEQKKQRTQAEDAWFQAQYAFSNAKKPPRKRKRR